MIGEYDQAGIEIKTYGYRPGSTWTADPLFMKIGTEYYWYQNDHGGTPQKLIATNGLVVWDAKYDTFGNCQIGIEAVTKIGIMIRRLADTCEPIRSGMG